ncbi:MAG: hypothetical protein H6970_13290 [Gammaproteobacteria bacterium]|nr:hypothetical protein [Gammaproteobacteria bacterium]MCP5458662.1 hypothetical protein [Gammaproteobacteria bacterium]
MAETLLVTGIHREELEFGDQVAALLDTHQIGVMRIPEGISHTRPGSEDLFYYNTRHREIYLQLRQQVKAHYRLLIDLHCGLNETGRCADVYCRDPWLLHGVAQASKPLGLGERLRVVRILGDSEEVEPPDDFPDILLWARTPIPEQIWNNRRFLYVGLEIYLADTGAGQAEDWRYARDLIETVRHCAIDAA